MSTPRKRSTHINLARMRKTAAVRPIALGIAGLFLHGCGDDSQQGRIYSSLDDCRNNNPPEFGEKCEAAYRYALAEAERTGPKFSSEYDCEYEFGPNQCHRVELADGNFFMPLMAGYVMAEVIDEIGDAVSPLYTSYSRHSPFRTRWSTADGVILGDLNTRSTTVRNQDFKPKPTVSRTIQRGGFGSTVQAKSGWSGGGSSGWGKSSGGSWGG